MVIRMMFCMLKEFAKIALVIGLIFSVSTTAFAQTAGQSEEKSKPSGGPRRQLATILFAGLGGAVLGLSTLSFYGRPQDKLSNIAIGFAFGVIAGTSFVTYKAATGPSEFYGQTRPMIEDEWAETSRTPGQMQTASRGTPLSLSYDFSF